MRKFHLAMIIKIDKENGKVKHNYNCPNCNSRKSILDDPDYMSISKFVKMYRLYPDEACEKCLNKLIDMNLGITLWK